MEDLLVKVIGGVIAVAIWAVFVKLFRGWKRNVLAKERETFTYAQIANKYEYWDGYANFFLEEDKKLTKTDFAKLSLDEKIQILTENFGPTKKHNRPFKS